MSLPYNIYIYTVYCDKGNEKKVYPAESFDVHRA